VENTPEPTRKAARQHGGGGFKSLERGGGNGIDGVGRQGAWGGGGDILWRKRKREPGGWPPDKKGMGGKVIAERGESRCPPEANAGGDVEKVARTGCANREKRRDGRNKVEEEGDLFPTKNGLNPWDPFPYKGLLSQAEGSRYKKRASVKLFFPSRVDNS